MMPVAHPRSTSKHGVTVARENQAMNEAGHTQEKAEPPRLHNCITTVVSSTVASDTALLPSLAGNVDAPIGAAAAVPTT
jgi:hypothetical protein